MIFIFLDGVGIGKADDTNPFFTARAGFLPFYDKGCRLPDGTPIKAVDAVLGVAGIPQSGTGQTTLFSGENVPALLSEHKASYPNKAMRKIIKEYNLLKKLRERGLKAQFINAYPLHSLLFSSAHVKLGDDGTLHFSEEFPNPYKKRISVTSTMMIANHMIPFDLKEINEKKSIFQDYSNQYLIDRGLRLPEFSPETAAEIIYKTSREYDFILYEYFQTDVFAHRRGFDDAVELIKKLDRLIGRLISFLDKHKDTLLVTSDHGNLEDHSTRVHTRNPVPLLVWGKGADQLRDKIDSIVDVTPSIVRFFMIN